MGRRDNVIEPSPCWSCRNRPPIAQTHTGETQKLQVRHGELLSHAASIGFTWNFRAERYW